ncbi:MAG: helix-turn-helix transcriptional regulator [Alphaproteobacteria bacterium]|nr:helix-turn-helix transcriptional regulator [Alphaproteobacteria bacterium]
MEVTLSDSIPNPIDIHVGKRVKLWRNILHITQKELGEMLGLAFQQIQKYEKGDNRISASRLWDISKVLGVPVGFFYEEIDDETDAQSPRPKNDDEEYLRELTNDPMQREETLKLVRAYYKIHNRTLAKNILNVIETASKSVY